MAKVSDKEFRDRLNALVEGIKTQAVPFADDSTERRIARLKRARVDKLYFASLYFPHIIELAEGYNNLYKTPDREIDWVKAGFADCHQEWFDFTNLDCKFHMIMAFGESSKSTLLGHVDVIHKFVFDEAWYIAQISYSLDHSETKVMPVKIELETNERLKADFGELRGPYKWENGEIVTKNRRKLKGYGMDMPLRGEINFGHRIDYLLLDDVKDPLGPYNPSIALRNLEHIKGDKLQRINKQKWGGVWLSNYVSKESIEFLAVNDRYTKHWVKKIYPVLVPNAQKTPEEKEIARQARVNGFSNYLRSAWEHQHPTPRLLREQQEDPDTFAAEMMMQPRDRKNAVYRDTDFKFYNQIQIRDKKFLVYTMVDPSVKSSGDYKSIISLGVEPEADVPTIFTLRASIRQASIDWMLDEMADHYTRFSSGNFMFKMMGIEGIGFAMLLEREFQRLCKKRGLHIPIHMVESVTNKEAKIESLVTTIRRGIALFDPTDSDQELLIRQFKGFPSKIQVKDGGIGDDGPDNWYECKKLIETFPHGLQFEYRSVVKRQAYFEHKGTY